MNKKVIEVKNLRKTYGSVVAIEEIYFEVYEGEIFGMVGPNGAGKTTIFKMSMGMLRPDSGTVELEGKNVTRLPMFRRARLGLGYLAQEPSVFRRLTTEQNMVAIAETLPITKKERAERVEELLCALELTRLKDSRADVLSGGERRRLQIARALLTRPKILLLDEPFAGVGPIAVADIQDIVRGLRDRGLSILLTDHNVRETFRLPIALILLVRGVFSGMERPLNWQRTPRFARSTSASTSSYTRRESERR